MTIKKLRVSFDIEVNALANALADHNCGMNIQVLGTPERYTKVEEPPVPKLDAPKRPWQRTAQVDIAVMAHLRANADRTVTTHELVVIVMNNGHKREYISNVMWRLRERGLVRNVGKGQYRIAKRGLNSDG